MAQSPLSKILSGKINWQESYASLILGAIIVIILGLLVANFLTRRGQQQIDEGQQISEPTQEEKISTSGGEYKTVAGDSLSKISDKFYQTQEFWPQLATVNNIANPNVLWKDIILKVPPKNEVEALKVQATVTSYQVSECETFFTIAQKVYGDGSKWTLLDRANGSKRLPNGNPLVLAGSTIAVPR